MTPFDTLDTPASTGRSLLQFSGGIAALQNTPVVAYLSNDPSFGSSSTAVNYSPPTDTVAGKFKIFVISNTCDSPTDVALLMNGSVVATQQIGALFTGAVEVKGIPGLLFPAGSLIAIRMNQHGTTGAGQQIRLSGVLANLQPARSPLLTLSDFYFAGKNLPQPIGEWMGNDADEFVSGTPILFPFPRFPGYARFLNVYVTSFAGGTFNGPTINLVKNAGTEDEATTTVQVPQFATRFSATLPANASTHFYPGDTLSCNYFPNGGVLQVIVTLNTVRA